MTDLVIIIIVLCLIIVCLITYISLYKYNIKHINNDLKDIINQDTNMRLTVGCRQKDFITLINELNSFIDDNKASIVNINRLNKNFRESITNISHDLRTPLTTAGGYIQMLKDETLSDKEKYEYLAIVEERQNTVKRLLEQLFEYARIESGEITFAKEDVDAGKVLTDILALYYDDFTLKNQEPDISLLNEKCMVLGSEDGLRRVFSNIIFNSLIHGDGGYKISCKKDGKYYLFEFSNSSEFISNEELANLFERFYTKDKSRNKKTTGLGLAIAKTIVTMMNGKIKGEYDKGEITIKVWVPML